MTTIRKSNILFTFFLVIFSLRFFDAVIAQSGFLKNLSFSYMVLAITMSIPFFFKFHKGFVLPVQLLCVAIVVSIFIAKYTWDQGFSYAPTTIPYLILVVFFLLLELNIPVRTIEIIVLIYGLIYIVLFVFQFTHSTTVYFGYHDEFVEDRGIIRVNFPGGGVFFLSCFMAINRITIVNTRYKFLWLLYALIGIIIIILQVTRQAILIILVVYLIHFIRNGTVSYKIATIAFFMLVGYIFFYSNNSISKGLIEQQKQDVLAGKNYIRILMAEYFLTQFNSNDITKVLGNGMPNNNSKYGRTLVKISEDYGYYPSDVGLIQIYITFGIFAIFAYLLIFVKSVIIPLPSDYYYLKYYLWSIFATCLTSDSLIHPSFLITTVFVLYCYQRLHQKNKTIELIGKVIY